MEETLPVAGPRRASLGDAMILMVAFAIGLALALRPLSDIGAWFGEIRSTGQPAWLAWWTGFSRKQGFRFLVVQGVVQLLACLVVPLTPALIVARLRRPRPPLRSLIRQPGLAASVALCVVPLIEVDLTFFDLVSVPPVLGAILPGLAVLAVWLVLLATRRWQPEASWVDRSGRLVGVFWLATIPWSIWVAS